jgi:CBS domain containing-hemolysin-like protein
MDDNPIHYLLLAALALFLIVLNGFFVATEFALVKVRSTRIKELAENGDAAARLVSRAIAQLDAYLSATQVGITLASLGLGWVGEPVLEEPISWLLARLGMPVHGALTTAIALALAFAIVTFMHIVFGEQAPKALAIQRAERTALWAVRPMMLFFWLFRPAIYVLNGAANGTLRLFGVEPTSEHDLVHSEEELRMIITASGSDRGGTLRETQAELLDNVFDFGHRLARQVMIHRTEIAALEADAPLADNVARAQTDGHSRYPVVRDDLDEVIGFVHTKDLYALFQRDPQGALQSILREALLVPETIRVDLLLRQMQRRRQHMAILVDEYGGTAGLVTVADLLEELVGAMPDEFEAPEEAGVVAVSAHTWHVDGRLPLADLADTLGHEPDCDEACDTVGGYAFWAFGRIPAVGDTVTTNDITLRVLAMDNRRVSRVEISMAPREAAEEEAVRF